MFWHSFVNDCQSWWCNFYMHINNAFSLEISLNFLVIFCYQKKCKKKRNLLCLFALLILQFIEKAFYIQKMFYWQTSPYFRSVHKFLISCFLLYYYAYTMLYEVSSFYTFFCAISFQFIAKAFHTIFFKDWIV